MTIGRKYAYLTRLPLWTLAALLAVFLAFSCSDTNPDSTPSDGDADLSEDGDLDTEADETPADPTTFRLGYSEIDITPFPTFERVLMGSYGIPGIGRAMVGVHDPLMAQVALFANDAGQALMIISVDLCGYEFEFGENGPGVRELRESISGALADTITIAPDQIIIAPSHNHTSTDLVGSAWDIGKPVPREQLQWHVETITQAAIEAAASLQDVSLSFSTFDFPGYAGRDEEPVGSGMRCSTVIDDRVYMLQAHDADERLLLTLANYAKHPTQIEWTLKEATADYIWAYRLEMEELSGAKAMFVQSFEAATHDGPLYADIPGETGSYEKTENFGRLFAQAVYAATDESVPATDFGIESKEEVISLPTAGFFDDMEMFCKLKIRTAEVGENGFAEISYTPVSWHRLGPAQFVTWPGEAAPEYGVMLRERMDTDFPFLVGLGNDQLGYFVTPESVEADPTGKLARYEARMGPGLGAGKVIMDVLESFGFLTDDE
jgi:hypothetical protein